jgi:hypothetical protein
MYFFKTLSIAAIVLGAVSNAVPLIEPQEDISLAARGAGPSKPSACTLDAALAAASVKSLRGNALFYTGVSLPKVQAVQKKSGRKSILDVFPATVRDELQVLCHKSGGDAWAIMSQAMAELASGETWVLKTTPGHAGGTYWNMEYNVMAQHRQVTLYRVDEAGAKVEHLL